MKLTTIPVNWTELSWTLCVWACDKRPWSEVGHPAQKSNSNNAFLYYSISEKWYVEVNLLINKKKKSFDPYVCSASMTITWGRVSFRWNLNVTMDTVDAIIVLRSSICIYKLSRTFANCITISCQLQIQEVKTDKFCLCYKYYAITFIISTVWKLVAQTIV